MPRALGVAPAAILVIAAFRMGGATVLGVPCHALDYQAGLAAAATALQRSPPDIGAAERTVSALRAGDSRSAAALQPVLADLASTPADIGDAELRLSSMSAALAYPAGSVCNENGAAARTALGSVYAAPDFRHLDDPPPSNPLASILDAIANLLSRGAGALGPFGGALLAATVVAAGLALAWRRWHGSAGTRGAAVEEPATRGDDPDAEWRAAERAAAGGEFREAVRRAFRSALLEAALRSQVHIDAAWTTRELLSRIDASGDVLLALAAAAAIFERAWYSGAAVTSDDWHRAEDRCATARRLVRRRRAVAG